MVNFSPVRRLSNSLKAGLQRVRLRRQIKDVAVFGNRLLASLHLLGNGECDLPLDARKLEASRTGQPLPKNDLLRRWAIFLFTRHPMPGVKPENLKRELTLLSPGRALTLAQNHLREYQVQGIMMAALPAVGCDLALFGYFQQFGHLNVVDPTTAPIITAFNTLALAAAVRARANLATIEQVGAACSRMGQATFASEIRTLQQGLAEHSAYYSLPARLKRYRQPE